MEFLYAHVAFTPEAERPRLTADLEALLTRYENHDRPRIPEKEPVSDDLPQLCKHLQAQKGFDFERFHEIQRRRIASGIIYWPPIAMKDFINSVERAFLCHHACIDYGKDCYRYAFGDFVDEPTTRCPCFPRTFAQKNWRLAAALLRSFRRGDTIITFNWDCLLEMLLYREDLWSAYDGYGLTVDFGRVRSLKRRSAIRILKPHGSINWRTTPYEDQLGLVHLRRLFGHHFDWSFPGSMDEDAPAWPFVDDVLLAPTYNKAYHRHRVLSATWDRAIDAIAAATEIVVIGYSLPDSDVSSRELLAYGLRQNKSCSKVQLVMPAYRQWADFVRSSGKEPERIADTLETWALPSAPVRRSSSR